jgi:hypothetical protein
LTEKQILLHIPLCNLLFNEEGVPEVNDANARAAVQESIAEFVTTDCVAREGYVPPRNVYRVSLNPATTTMATAPPTPPSTANEEIEDANVHAELATEEIDENGWTIEKNDFRIRGWRMLCYIAICSMSYDCLFSLINRISFACGWFY